MADKAAKYEISPGRIQDPVAKKEAVVLLRWILVIAACALMLVNREGQETDLLLQGIVLVLIVSNLVVSMLPVWLFSKALFDHSLLVIDIFLISGSIWISRQTHSDVFLLYFLIIMIAAVGETLRAIIWSAVVVAVVYLLVSVSIDGVGALAHTELLIRVPFFFIVAVFYGYFTQLVRAERSEKRTYQERLSVAQKLGKMSSSLADSLDRKKILSLSVDGLFELCEAECCCVLSRGSADILACAGNAQAAPVREQVKSLCSELGKKLSLQEESSPKSGEGLLAHDGYGDRVRCFRLDRYTFLPFGGNLDADLYLCLTGEFTEESLEYASLLLVNAAMALNNAGQYQALVHEAEKRQDLIRELAKTLEYKSQFLANMSHEIRTPIYSFIGFGELLSEGAYGELNKDQREVVLRMIENANHLLELLNNILELSKAEADEIKTDCTPGSLVSFVDDIAETCVPLLRDKPVSIQVNMEGSLPIVITDWILLRQIAMNLVSNAVKFTKEGRVTIAVSQDAKRHQFLLAVEDTGVGIEPARAQEIFEPFRQLDNSYARKYAGTGLGLAITKRQVEALGGSIELESEVGQGSRFVVSLPQEPQ